MPTIPTYGGPQVREQALGAPMMGTPDVSSGAQALARAVGVAGEVVDRFQERKAETEANRIDTEVTAGWLKWDAENRRKYQGQNIDEYEAKASEWWDKAKADYANVDPRVRQRIGEALGRKRNQAFASVLSHSASVREQYADQQSDAAAQTTIDFAVDTGNAAAGADRVRQIVAEKAARKGWDTAMTEAENQRQLGTLHLAMITKIAETDATKAQSYYQANKGEIPAAAQGRVEQVLKAEGDNQFATQFAAERATKPLGEQLADAGKITDPQRREKAIQQIRSNHALVKEAQQEREKAASDTAWQLVGQGKRVPELTLAQMDGHERVKLQDYLKERAKKAVEGTPVKTDPVFLAKVYDMARDDPEGFKKLRMEPLALRISGSDMEQVARVQRDMNKPDKEKDVATTMQLVNAAVSGWKPEKKGLFQTAVFDEIERQEGSGKKLTYEQKRQVIDRMLLDGEVLSGAWYKNDPNKKFYEATPEERKRFAPTISSADRKLIVEALQAEGVKSPSDDQILARFKLAKGMK